MQKITSQKGEELAREIDAAFYEASAKANINVTEVADRSVVHACTWQDLFCWTDIILLYWNIVHLHAILLFNE